MQRVSHLREIKRALHSSPWRSTDGAHSGIQGPGVVTVDVTARQVRRVQVVDEEVRYEQITPPADVEAGVLPDYQLLCDEARQIAEEAEWPPWEFGL